MRSTTSRLIAEHRAARQATAGHAKINPWPGLHVSRSSPFDTRMHMDSLVVMSRRFREASAGLLSGSAVQS
jgi:hypothetical protein